MKLRRLTRLPLLLTISLGLYAGCDVDHTTPAEVEPDQSCVPVELPYRLNWLGGDNGVSVKLPDQRILWLFGDSFVGNPQLGRAQASFVSNTVGVSKCVSGQFKIDYFWGWAGPRPAAVYRPAPGYAYWPAEAFVHNSELFILYWKVEYTPGGLGFTVRGATVGRIASTSGWDPAYWSVQYFDLVDIVDDVDGAIPAANAVVVGSHVYLYASLTGPNVTLNSIILVRSPLSTFASNDQTLEYFSNADVWEPGLNVIDAKILVETGATKFNSEYHESIGKWIVTYVLPFRSNAILMRTADNLEGPWSPEVPIYEIPELIPGHPSYSPNVFCYGGEEHYQYQMDTSLLLTYCCNSFDSQQLLSDMSLYKPVLVTVPIETPLEG